MHKLIKKFCRNRDNNEHDSTTNIKIAKFPHTINTLAKDTCINISFGCRYTDRIIFNTSEKLRSVDSAMSNQQVIFSINDKIQNANIELICSLPPTECMLEFFINAPDVSATQNNEAIQLLWIRY